MSISDLPRTAILLVGQARTFRDCWRTQYWSVYSQLPNPYFFVVVEDDEQAKDMDLIYERYPSDRVFMHRLPRVAAAGSLPRPSEEYAKHAAWAVNTPTWSIMKCFWNYNEAWKFFLRKESNLRSSVFDSFQLIVRTRPDAFFHEFFLPEVVPGENDFVSLWWERYGGVNDRICFMGRKAAQVHMTMADRVQSILDAGCPLHGETFVGGALRLGGVKVHHTLDAWLSFKRLDGELVRPRRNADDVMPIRR